MPEMTEARAKVLARIRAAKPAAGDGDSSWAWGRIERNYLVEPDMPPGEVLELLEDRLKDYDAVVFHCVPNEIASMVEKALRSRGKKRVVIPDGVAAEWLPEGVEFVRDVVLDRDSTAPRALSADELDKVDGVLTGATIAIADTGTIILQNAAGREDGQGRRALTLVPDYHLCVLFTSQVVQTVPQAMRMLQGTATVPTTMFSGPSATADIEMTRIKGVHGPRFLDVVLVRDR